MPRSNWKGFLKLSLVTVPVKGYTATRAAGRVQLHQLHAPCHSRIRYRKVCPIHGEVSQDEIVSGYEYADGQYVVLEDEQLDELRGETDRSLTVDAIVPYEAIDPVYFTEKSSYIVPDGAIGQKPFGLIRRCLGEDKVQAVGRLALRGREEVVAIRALDDVLAVTTLKYESQVAPVSSVAEEVESQTIGHEELLLAKTLFRALQRRDFTLANYHDTYTQRLRELVENKVEGKEVVTAPTPEEPRVINLMDALRRSVAQTKGDDTESRPARGKRATRKTTGSTRRTKSAARTRRRSG